MSIRLVVPLLDSALSEPNPSIDEGITLHLEPGLRVGSKGEDSDWWAKRDIEAIEFACAVLVDAAYARMPGLYVDIIKRMLQVRREGSNAAGLLKAYRESKERVQP